MNDPAAATPAPRYRFRASGVSVSRGGVQILRDVSLSLEPGQAAILRGPNGSGKTTLLRAFAGLLRKDEGEVEVTAADGKAVLDPAALTVYCGPLNAVKFSLTVDENLRFWAALYATPLSEIAGARAAVGLDAYAGRNAGALSTGFCRRLGLARLLLARRPVWLADEPTASLDTASARAFEKLVERHCDNGGVAIIATHDAVAIPHARHIELKAEVAA
ncbi:MAG: heme ABC exporter, ATP-binding protein CcmA [Alphaproteobacteria bacterium RIFCSPHIGHO2_12_FULL_63_12]|nr:MAG: heme ABC exporter, ATP-binding protein CcmA [Alphaproteobacteria bacterium RIFCSPHIGHO2_12_FULL_63_12]